MGCSLLFISLFAGCTHAFFLPLLEPSFVSRFKRLHASEQQVAVSEVLNIFVVFPLAVSPKNVRLKKSTRRNKKEELHMIPIYLRNQVVTGDYRNVVPKFLVTVEYEWMEFNHLSRQLNFEKPMASMNTIFDPTFLQDHVKLPT